MANVPSSVGDFEFLAVDPGEAAAHAFKVALNENHGDDAKPGQYQETLWLDGAGGFEISNIEIGGQRT